MEGELLDLGFVEVHEGGDVCCCVSPFCVVAYHGLALVAAGGYDEVFVVGVVVEGEHAGSGFEVSSAELVFFVVVGYGFV